MYLTSLPREPAPSMLSFHAFLPPLGTNCISYLSLSVFSTFLSLWHIFFCHYSQSFPTLTKKPSLDFFSQATILSPLPSKLHSQVFIHFSLTYTMSSFPSLFFLTFLQPLTFLTTIITLYSRREIGFGFDRLRFGFLLCVTLDRFVSVCFPYL